MTKISFLASHGGSAAKHIITAIRNNQLDAQIGIVITNNRNSDIFHWCMNSEVKVVHLSERTHPDEIDKDRAIYHELSAIGTNLIVLSGYMKKIGPITLENFSNKILNIHPSLLPNHGGKGMYGDRVHNSVLNSGDKQSGASVHFINDEYDKGPLISQQTIDLEEGETIESLRTKVQAIECDLYLNCIKKILQKEVENHEI